MPGVRVGIAACRISSWRLEDTADNPRSIFTNVSSIVDDLFPFSLAGFFSRSRFLGRGRGDCASLAFDQAIGLACARQRIVLAPFILVNLPLFGIRLDVNQSFMTIPAEEQSIGERALLVEFANHIFADHALTGIGLGASPVAMKDAYPSFPVDYQPPHLTLLDTALETGIFGATFYFLFLVLPWVVLLRHRDLLNDRISQLLLFMLAVTIVGFFDYYTWLLVPGRLWQWLAWGLLAAAMEKANQNELA